MGRGPLGARPVRRSPLGSRSRSVICAKLGSRARVKTREGGRKKTRRNKPRVAGAGVLGFLCGARPPSSPRHRSPLLSSDGLLPLAGEPETEWVLCCPIFSERVNVYLEKLSGGNPSRLFAPEILFLGNHVSRSLAGLSVFRT